MKAMVLKTLGPLKDNPEPLELEDIQTPCPKDGQILIKVENCGVCHTELDEIEGRTPPSLPIILGHEVVGKVVEKGSKTNTYKIGDRVGVAWIYSACGKCQYCLSEQENLCHEFQATGRDANGGYAEYMTVDEGFATPIPEIYKPEEAAPLLCAGAIGYRSLRLSGITNGQSLGLTGFGASAHLLLKLVRHILPATNIFVFARNPKQREFALELGAVWSGDTEEQAPELLDSIIDTTPVWKPIVAALKQLKPGGRLVINAIRKENVDKEILLDIDYPEHLWMEKEIKSVANVARKDVQEFIRLAAEVPIKPEVQLFPLEEANQALMELRTSKILGAKVLKIS